MQCLHGLRWKKTTFSSYRTLLLLFSAPPLWNVPIFTKLKKKSVLWLANYPVHCDWSNTSSVWWKCYTLYHIWNISFYDGDGNNTTAKIKVTSLRIHLCGVMQIFPHSDVDLWGRVLMRHLRKAWMSLKRLVHPKMKISLCFTQPQSILGVYDFLLSDESNRSYSKTCSLLFQALEWE